jgi:hypothetical protein
VQRFDAIADGGDHPFDLVVFAFRKREAQLPFVRGLARGGAHRARVVLQHDTLQQAADLALIDRVLGDDLVNLGHVVLRRTHAVDELAIVGQQQHPGRVLVEPADGLDPLHGTLLRSLAQGRGQQRVDARISGRLARALGAGRLVQHQVGEPLIWPLNAVHLEAQAFGFEFGGCIVHDAACHGDMALLDQTGAYASGAKALRIENVLQLHGQEYLKHGARGFKLMRKWDLLHRATDMGTDKQSLCLLAGFVLSISASAEQWFTVSGADAALPRSMVEIDLETIRVRDQGGEALIRLTHDTARTHPVGFAYRSFVATAQFDCQRRSIGLVSAAYYSQPEGKGTRLGADSSGKEAGMPPALLDSIPAQARQALLKAMCATTRTN